MIIKPNISNAITIAAIIVLIIDPIQYNKFTIKFSETFEKDFDKGIKKSFTLGWLTGANQMRDFGNCTVSYDTLIIMLKKDTSDFNYLMDSSN